MVGFLSGRWNLPEKPVMKNTPVRWNRARVIAGGFVMVSLMAPLLPDQVRAEGANAAPLLEFASGLPGKQVRLTWPSQAGVRYSIEKSTTLTSSGAGGWRQVALVEGSGANTEWRDPVATTTKAFYRVSQPLAEVFSISPPVLSPTGGTLVIRGQCIPAGSFLVIQIPGQAPILVPLSDLGNGEWQALVSGTFVVGNEAAAVSVQDGNGVTLVTLNQPLEITLTGRAVDSPGSLPPAPPTAVAPIAGGFIDMKTGSIIAPGSNSRKLVASNIGSSGQDGVDLPLWQSKRGYDYYQAQSQLNSSSLLAIWAGKKGYDYYQAQSALNSASIVGAWLGRRGYDYYKAASDNAASALQNNPAFQQNQNQGTMPGMKLANNKHPDLMKRAMGPGAISPAPSGLPGEVSFQFCALSLETPAGPPLQLIHTYRSKPPVISGGGGGGGTVGSHWERCYDISIKPIPTTAGSNATRVEVCDGGGRSDIFYRQPNGTYRCDGMFREGSFVGDTFTLTFADKGTWTFKPLSDPAAPGMISTITDRNGVPLTCVYTGTGQLDSVRSQFGQQLTMAYGSDGSLSSVIDNTGRSVYYTYCGPQDPDGSPGDLKSISAPQVGPSSPFGPTTFTYLTGQKIPQLNGNLRSITDGAGRLLEAFTYSAQSDPTAVDFDTCATHDRHRTSSTTGGVTGEVVTMSFEPLSSGAYMMTENDELGRVTQTTFDRLHREISVREYTGFAVPGAVVTSASLPLSGKLYQTDPDFFETTCAYNADSHCTRITRPDGSQELTTYDRDFRRACPVRERGNLRVMTLRAPGGEIRTVTCDYLPDFGTPESARPGNPIGGLTVKGGRNPGGGLVNSAARKGWDGSVKGRQYLDMDSDDDGVALLKKEEGGRHTPFQNKLIGASAAGGITGGVVAGIVVAAVCARGDVDEDCDGRADNDDPSDLVRPKQKAWLTSNFRTSTVSAYGQVSTFGYDANGNRTSATSPVAGRGSLFSYNSNGQVTSSTVLNGSSPSFTDECAYDAATGFPSSIVSDPAGLRITTSFERNNLGLVTRVVDPLGNDWLYQYNALDECVQIQSPSMPNRISMNFTTDASGRVCRCDVDYRTPDGSLVSANPVYSTFFVRDARCRLVQIAAEERPVNSPPAALAPAPSDLASYNVCDITLDNAGQVTRVSTPAACRGQATDLACDFTYTERGQLHRCIEGGLGTPGAVTTEYAYDLVGATSRCTTLGDTPAASPQTLVSYDGFHRISSITDPMGNVVQYTYGNDGSVMTSVYGKLPGSAGNVLLSSVGGRLGAGAGTQQNLLSLPGIDEACYSLNVKSSAFFAVETEDDTITVERFTPGSTAPPATEITVIDRSPAGLVQQVRCNGDVLANSSYDTAGRLTGRSHSAGHYALTLDGKGCVTSSTWTALSTLAGIPPKTFTISRILDPLSRCTRITDGVGNTTQFAFDSLGRFVSETEPGGLVIQTAYDGASSAGPYSSRISADLNGDGIAEILSSSLARCGELVSTTDSNGFPTTFTNDAIGRCVRSDSPDGTFESIVFNRQRFVATATFSDGTQCDYTHDLNGQVKTITWSNVPSGVVAVALKTLQYDGLGNVISCVQGTSSVTATYDSCGDQTSETQNGLTVSRTFNHRGRTSVTYPDGKRFQESRNAFGDLTAVSAVTAAGVVVTPPIVTQDFLGHQVCRTVQRNGVTSTFTYRSDGEVSPAGPEDRSFGSCVRETITNSASAILSDTLTTRDANQRTITCQQGFSVQGQSKTRLTVTPRDVYGNVTSCVISRKDSATSPPVIESSVSYIYVLEASKRIGRSSEIRNGVAGTYTRDSSLPPGDLQRGQYSTWPGGGLTWDDNGNLATFQKGTSQLTFVHDSEGNLVRVMDQTGNAVVGYDYNSRGQRTAKLAPSPTTGNLEIIIKFAYNGSTCIQETGPDNLADMTFVCADGIRQCISTRNGTLYYPHGGGATNLERKSTAVLALACTAGRDTADLITLVTDAAGVAVQRFDCDESRKPIFLTSDGSPSSANSSTIGLRWLAPECAWEPEIGMFTCPGGVYSPDLGLAVSAEKNKFTYPYLPPLSNISAR